jgi:hypothetical protein
MYSPYAWQQFYRQAILETDRSRLPVLVRAARAAINVRVEQLRVAPEASDTERQAIEDALAGLRILEQEAKCA